MFVFRLERVLKIQSDLLKKCMLEIATIDHLIDQTGRELTQTETQLKHYGDKLKDMLKRGATKEMLLFYGQIVSRLQDRKRELLYRLNELKTAKEKKLQEAKELNKEKKKLERLKEAEFERYKQNEARKEASFLDEIANIKTARSRINR